MASAAVLAVALVVTASAPAQTPMDQLRKRRALPNLIVTSVQEPPDFAAAGDQIRLSITVANEGRTRARRTSFARVLLSSGRAPSADDIRLPGRVRIPALNPGQSITRRITVTIPSGLEPNASYYFVTCADVTNRVREYEERLLNCRLSGQAVDFGGRPVGPPGPMGDPGARGEPGSPGDIRRLPRTELALGDRLLEPVPADPGDDEGSTQTSDALQVGPLTIRYLCRQTTNGDNGDPSAAFGAADAFDEDGDEAKILIYSSGEGTFSFSGPQGQRMNIPAGNGEAGRDDEAGGEGKRQVLSAIHDPDPNSTFRRNGRSDQDNNDEPEVRSGFRSGSAYVAHSGGTEFIIHAWAGIDVLGVGNDRCVFGGTVQVVQG